MVTGRQARAFTVATDDVIASMISAASERLVVVAPAVWPKVATAICERWRVLGPEAVTVVLDSDPEVYRLGYGQIAAMEELQRTATAVKADIHHQPGLRIGVVIADSKTLVYTPTAQLVEAGPNTHGAANAICLEGALRDVEGDLGLGGAVPQLGRAVLGDDQVASVKNDLEANPPQTFDLARTVRVFNSFIEFVELEVRGTELSRRMIAIPSYLLAVADADTREQLRATFRLVPPEDELSGADIEKDRRLLTGEFLRVIPGYGTVVLRRDKVAFLAAVKKVEAAVQEFSKRAKASIQDRIDRNVADLVKSLLPGLAERPPRAWTPSSGERPTKEKVQSRLEDALRKAFGTADLVIRAMKVRCMFKGVTYELLSNPAFLEAATKAIPDLERFHTEIDAAEAKKEPR